MEAQIISTDARSITLSLAFGQHVADLGALRLAFEMVLEASKEQTRLSEIAEPTRQDRLHYEQAAEAVRSHLCGIGTILLPVARAIAEAAGETGAETPAEDEEGDRTQTDRWVATVNAPAEAVDRAAGNPADVNADRVGELSNGYKLLAKAGPEGVDQLEALQEAGASAAEAAQALEKAQALIDDAMSPERNPKQTLTVDLLDAMQEAAAVVTQANAEETEEVEADPTGFEPGKGSAHDYIPSWMTVPPLYSGEGQDDPLAVVKLFTPDSGWTWYITECDGEDTCFGLVVGHCTELGYFSLAEMAGVKGPHGLRIERDLWFEPTPVTQLREYRREWGENGPYKGTRELEPVEEAKAQAESADESAVEIEGWRLTQRQYQESKAARVAGGVPVLNVADADEHKRLVQEALERGEVVPTHVFKDYADLWKPWEWPLEKWLQMEHDIQRTGGDMRYVAPTGETVLWPSVTSRRQVGRLQHEYEVKQAVQQNWAVPAHVLGDYPDLETEQGGAADADPVDEEPEVVFVMGDESTTDEAADTDQVEEAEQAIPLGALRIGYFPKLDVPDGLVWTGDVRAFQQRGGEPALRAAFDYLQAVAAEIETELGFAVLRMSKDYDAGTYAMIAEGDGKRKPDNGAFSCEIEPWGVCEATLLPADSVGLARRVEHLVRHCYAEEDVPEDWHIPGLHLAKHLRAMVAEAHATESETHDGKVVWDGLWDTFWAQAQEDTLLGHYQEKTLWSPRQFVESLELEVIRPKSWTYVPAEERKGKLAKKYEGNLVALMEALGNGPAGKRLNLLLAALADAGEPIPVEYITAEKAGKWHEPPKEAEPPADDPAPKAEQGESKAVVVVDAETLEKASNTYSAQLIAEHNRIKKPFTVEGAEGLWICTGKGGPRGDVRCCQVIPREAFEGETNTDPHHYAGRVVMYRKTEYVLTDRKLTLTLDESEKTVEEGGVVVILADEPAAEEKPKANPKLPPGFPAVIEVDLGRTKGWRAANVVKVKEPWLYYRLEDNGNGAKPEKVKLIAKDMLWRVAASAAAG